MHNPFNKRKRREAEAWQNFADTLNRIRRAQMAQDFPETPERDPDTDPIYVTHAQDPSLDEDELIMHTMIEPTKKNTFPEDPTGPSILNPDHPDHPQYIKENE